MAARTEVMTLVITYDDRHYDPPADWSWHLLVDDDLTVTRHEGCLIEATTPIEEN